MALEEIKKAVKAVEARLDKEVVALHKRITMLDEKVDPTVDAVRKSSLTPVWIALMAFACLLAGIWLGLKL